MMKNPIAASLSPLIGQPCWGGKRGQGSILTLEFGEPHLLIREPNVSTSGSPTVRARMARRTVNPVGAWTLWIDSCVWKLLSHGEEIANEEADEYKLRLAVHKLNGQRLMGIELDAVQHKTTFYFDLGGTLRSSPYENETQWLLYMPNNRVLTYEADGRFSLGAQNLKPEQEKWQRLPQEPQLIEIGSPASYR